MSNEVEKCTENTESDRKYIGEEEIDAWTFIRTVTKEEAVAIFEKSCDKSTFAKPNVKGIDDLASSSQSLGQERKSSACSLVNRILKPSLRMKAFVNHRQDTFHSLDMHVDHTQETADPSKSASPLSLSGELSGVNDFLKMPSIESIDMSPSVKMYKKMGKINSEPSMMKTKGNSLAPNGTSSCKTAHNDASEGKVVEQKKRVLHTFTQPDGCIIGYTTEEPISYPEVLDESDYPYDGSRIMDRRK